MSDVDDADPDLQAARAAKPKAAAAFAQLCKVNGVGITRVGDGYAIRINVEEHPTPGCVLPDQIDGVPVVVEVVGRVFKQ